MKKLSVSSLGNGNLNLLRGPDNFKKEIPQALMEGPFWRSGPNVSS